MRKHVCYEVAGVRERIVNGFTNTRVYMNTKRERDENWWREGD